MCPSGVIPPSEAGRSRINGLVYLLPLPQNWLRQQEDNIIATLQAIATELENSIGRASC